MISSLFNCTIIKPKNLNTTKGDTVLRMYVFILSIAWCDLPLNLLGGPRLGILKLSLAFSSSEKCVVTVEMDFSDSKFTVPC